jgi:hypothetical protein
LAALCDSCVTDDFAAVKAPLFFPIQSRSIWGFKAFTSNHFSSTPINSFHKWRESGLQPGEREFDPAQFHQSFQENVHIRLLEGEAG